MIVNFVLYVIIIITITITINETHDDYFIIQIYALVNVDYIFIFRYCYFVGIRIISFEVHYQS